MKPIHRSRITILCVTALFMAPVLVALYLNSSWSDWRPTTTRNYGSFIEPATLIEGLETRTTWVVLLDGRGGCNDACLQDLTLLRQVERALGRHAETAERGVVLDASDLTTENDLAVSFPNLRQFTAAGVVGNTIDQLSRDSLKLPNKKRPRAFIIDPQNYLVMAYAAPLDGTEVRKDLNHLIKWTDDS